MFEEVYKHLGLIICSPSFNLDGIVVADFLAVGIAVMARHIIIQFDWTYSSASSEEALSFLVTSGYTSSAFDTVKTYLEICVHLFHLLI